MPEPSARIHDASLNPLVSAERVVNEPPGSEPSTPAPATERGPLAPELPQGDVGTVAPVARSAWRYAGLASVALALLASLLAVGLWLQYQSAHVVSRSAMVRGHLTQIGTRLSGVLVSTDVAEGARVTAGQVLGRLDDRHIRTEAQEAQAEIEGLQREVEVEQLAIEHQRRLLLSKAREATANLAAAHAEIAAARSRAQEAQAFHEARVALFERSMVSREEVRKAETRSAEAQAQLNVARATSAAVQSAEDTARLESDGLSVRRQRIDVLKANVSRARSRLDRANADLEGTVIRAPQDGAVMRWLIKPGGSIEVGQPVVSMAIGKDHWIEVWIDEDDIGQVRIGSEASVTLPSFPKQEFVGVVESIGLTTDFEMPPPDMPQPRFTRMRGTPVVGVLVRLRDAPQLLLPGLSAVVAIHRSPG